MNFLKKLFSKSDISPKSGKLCECVGGVRVRYHTECEYFPLRSGHHTSFILGECSQCKGFSAFPDVNLQIAIHEASEEGQQILQELGFKL